MPLRRLTPNARVLLSLLALLTLFIGIPLLLHAVVPGWWEEKHVYQYEGESVADASDFSAANQGQLKNMAVSAYEYLLGKIPAGLASSSDPGGLGPIVAPDANVQGDKGSPGWRILNIIQQWVVVDSDGSGTGKILRRVMNGNVPAEPEQYSITGTGPRQIATSASTHKDFSAVNLGQMKAVAAPFYDRLAAVYAPFPYPKPWATDGGTANDFATANLGQLKRVFSFDLDRDSDEDGQSDLQELSRSVSAGGSHLNPFSPDTDGDGIPDGEEIQNGTNPGLVDSDGDGVNDANDRYPNDPRRSEDIPPKYYAVADLTASLPESERNTFHTKLISMNNNDEVAYFGYKNTQDGALYHVYCWKNGSIDSAGSYSVPMKQEQSIGLEQDFLRSNYWHPHALGASGLLTGDVLVLQLNPIWFQYYIANITYCYSTKRFTWKAGQPLPPVDDYLGVSDQDLTNPFLFNESPYSKNTTISPNGAHTIGYSYLFYPEGPEYPLPEPHPLLVDDEPHPAFPNPNNDWYSPGAITDSGHFIVTKFSFQGALSAMQTHISMEAVSVLLRSIIQ